MRKLLSLGVSLIAATGWCQVASAQESGLAEMEVGQLRPEVQRRYDEALAATQSPEYLSATDSRFMWASEAKAWCGISLGFLKTSTRDAESLSRCDRFHAMMSMRTPLPMPVVVMPEPPKPIVRNPACENALAATVFFEWDSSTLPANIDETLAFAKENMGACRWSRFTVVGHADRSGSDSYNDPLSLRRAQAVATRMQAMGLPASALAVSAKGESEPKVMTADGERNPTNRRVEVTAAN
jgi:outer membrane protein OmpA-like peptidoglycan-associated protein